MSYTLARHDITRSTRQSRTREPVSVTATAAATAQAYARLIDAPWSLAGTLDASMPPHNYAQSGLSEQYDAAKYCGDYASGAQHAYATAACYTIKVPDDAQSGDACDIEAIAATAYGDRWLADGAILAAIISPSATPPADWSAVLDPDVQTDPAIMAVVPDNDGADSAVDVILSPAAPIAAAAYIHLIVRLADYTTHRGAWIEGSAIVDVHSITVTYSRTVTPDDIPSVDTAVRLADARTRVTFSSDKLSLSDPWLRKHWAAAMLRAGRTAVSDTSPSTVDEIGLVLSPQVGINGATVTAIGWIAHLYCPADALADGYLHLVVQGAISGDSVVRLSLFTSEPDASAAATWRGDGATCVASYLYSGLAHDDTIALPIRGTISGDVWAVASIEAVAESDGAATSGWSDSTGISLIDAHIAPERYSPASVVAPEWIAYDDEGRNGLYLPLLYNTLQSAADYAALSLDGGIYRHQTSYAAWLGDTPLSASYVSGADNYVLAIDGGVIRIAGAPPGTASAADGASAIIAAATELGVVAMVDLGAGASEVVAYGAAAALFTRISGWGGVDGEYPFVYGGGCLVVARKISDSTAMVDGAFTDLDSAAVTAVEALTDVAEIRCSSTHIIARHSDGTCTAITNAARADAGAGVDVSTWTGVIQVAAAADCVFALKADGAVLRSGLTPWINWTPIDAAVCKAIIGSGYRRAAFRLA